ncbi:hypothetical protein K6119_19350 [Paracrocinitomix mangrovi]|uniref:hypothetical protein n=1 Tax=Paracrocinitomix mangrovi TaxID=2862509 RepID=UPI001C8EEC8B|nr:hypothetical protein [Paracrocinitomix mangrovi]UKN01883.1 hypothetical protein K6119_19350 [Paracrocinitomix mangrovi]
MSQFEPISGVSLELYAKLCGLMSQTKPEETDKHAQIAQENGVNNESWEAAKTGWTKMMTDPTHAMAIQQVFMPIYQETVASMQEGEPISIEKYAEIKAAMIFEKDAMGNKIDPNIILGRYGYHLTQWGTMETYWTSRIAKDEHGRVIDNYDEEAHRKFTELINHHGAIYAAQD